MFFFLNEVIFPSTDDHQLVATALTLPARASGKMWRTSATALTLAELHAACLTALRLVVTSITPRTVWRMGTTTTSCVTPLLLLLRLLRLICCLTDCEPTSPTDMEVCENTKIVGFYFVYYNTVEEIGFILRLK